MARSKHTGHQENHQTNEAERPEPAPSSEGARTAPDAERAEDSSPASEASARIRESEERALRAQAELQNAKRRHREEIERIRDTATKDLVVALLPIMDDLERALDAAAGTQNLDALRTGVELTLNKLQNALKSVGVERMAGVGAQFDPNLHEAVLQTPPTKEQPSGTISQEIRSGYTQHGHVIRPSMVAVAHE